MSYVEAMHALEQRDRWFVVQTLPRQELRAKLNLERQGYRVCLPQIQKTIRHSRQLRTVQTALFPRYLFIRLNLTRDRWSPVRSTIGVSRLITADERPVPVPVGVVEEIIERTSESGMTRLDCKLSIGERVRILSGPFAECVGTLARLDEAGRVRVLLEMMGNAVPVALHRSVLAEAQL